MFVAVTWSEVRIKEMDSNTCHCLFEKKRDTIVSHIDWTLFYTNEKSRKLPNIAALVVLWAI